MERARCLVYMERTMGEDEQMVVEYVSEETIGTVWREETADSTWVKSSSARSEAEDMSPLMRCQAVSRIGSWVGRGGKSDEDEDEDEDEVGKSGELEAQLRMSSRVRECRGRIAWWREWGFHWVRSKELGPPKSAKMMTATPTT